MNLSGRHRVAPERHQRRVALPVKDTIAFADGGLALDNGDLIHLRDQPIAPCLLAERGSDAANLPRDPRRAPLVVGAGGIAWVAHCGT